MRTYSIRVGIPAIALGLVVSGGIAVAAPMEPVNDNWDPQQEVVALVGGWDSFIYGEPRLAQVFSDKNVYFGSNLQAFGSNLQAMETGPGGAINYLGRCESMDVEPCTSASTVFVNVMLPHCTPQRTRDCVESLYARQNGRVVEATFAETWDTPDSYTFGAIPTSRGATPRSGKTPLYRLQAAPHSGGSLYAASVSVQTMIRRDGGTWRANLADLAGQVIPVKKEPFAFGASNACMDVGTQARDRSACLSIDHRLPDVSLGMRVNLTGDFGSWVFGRVQDPQIQLTSAGESMSLNVEGRPLVVPHLVAVLPAEDLSPGMWSGSPLEKGTMLASFSAGQFGSLDRWSLWNAPSRGTAGALRRLWIFRSTTASLGLFAWCVKRGEVAGWISTNAMVYEARPPQWNPALGALDFRIGGPAYQPDGTSLVSAEYDLLLRSDVAACVWPGQKIANVATVSVIGGGSGEEVTTTAVGERAGWVSFTARNVFFPEPASVRARSAGANPTVRVVIPPRKTAKPVTFTNCKAMRKKYRDGVSRTGAVNTVTVKGKKIARPALGKPFMSDSLYNANIKLDIDRDGLACEREPRVR